jgi:hypothetical protein
MDNPPLRLLFGRDAIKIVEATDARKSASNREWRDFSASTDWHCSSTFSLPPRIAFPETKTFGQ